MSVSIRGEKTKKGRTYMKEWNFPDSNNTNELPIISLKLFHEIGDLIVSNCFTGKVNDSSTKKRH